MERYRIGIVGCAGRMGHMLLKVAGETEGCVIAGGTEAPDSPAQGRDLGAQAGLGELGIKIGADPVALFAQADAVIDFTAPAISVKHAELAAQAQAVLVLGTTGLDKEQDAAIARAAQHATIVQAANMSLAVVADHPDELARLLDRPSTMEPEPKPFSQRNHTRPPGFDELVELAVSDAVAADLVLHRSFPESAHPSQAEVARRVRVLGELHNRNYFDPNL